MDLQARELSAEAANDILKTIAIPSCPAVVSALLEEARREDVDFHKITRLVSGDVGLAAAMLKTANSPFFGLRTRVTTIAHAIGVLGIKNLLNIILSQSVRDTLKVQGISMERFWDRSNYNAIACSRLADWLRTAGRENAYTFGLFHDCGIPILIQRFPDYKQVLASANQSGQRTVSAEDKHYGTSHAVVGSMLAKNWQLPASVAQAILLHHDMSILSPGESTVPPDVQSLVAIIQIAEHIIAQFLGFNDDTEWDMDGPVAMEFLGLNHGELSDILSDMLEELEKVKSYRG